MRILVSAYACEPDRGSESEVGWKWVQAISRNNEVWVLTRSNNKEKIQQKLILDRCNTSIHFIYNDLPLILKKWKKGKKGIYLYYLLWQISIYFTARKLNSIYKFDYIHHITFVSFRFPSFLIFLPVRFIWGPTAAGGRLPQALKKELPFRIKVKENIRFLHEHLTRYDPIIRYIMKKSYRIIVVNQDSFNFIPERYKSKVIKYPAVGIDVDENNNHICNNLYDESYFNILSVGTLNYLKGHHLLIEAISQLKKRKIKLTIVGEGENDRSIKNLVKNSYLDDYVDFKGGLSRTETLKYIQQCDVFALLSLRDSGGMAILEAMSFCKPIVCLDIGGPSEIVDSECGFKISCKNKNETIRLIVSSFEQLIDKHKLKTFMGRNAYLKCKGYFDWKVKEKYINDLYL